MGKSQSFFPGFLACALFALLLLSPCSSLAQGTYALKEGEMLALESGLERLSTLNRKSQGELTQLKRQLAGSQEKSARLGSELMTLSEELKKSQEESVRLALELRSLQERSMRQEELLRSANESCERYAKEQKKKLRAAKAANAGLVAALALLLACAV